MIIMVLDDGKEGMTHVNVNDLDIRADVTEGAIEEKLGTRYDQRDMARMGKRQELRVCTLFSRHEYETAVANVHQRNFQFFSIWGYAVILGCTWEWFVPSTM